MSIIGPQHAAGLGRIEALRESQPQLTVAERAEYDRIWERLRRATSDHRRAEKRGDTKKLAAAERAITRAKQFREAFVQPRVGHLWAPTRIIARFESHWSGPGIAGVHRQECEMILDHKDLSGPQYRTVRVLRDEGEPPSNPRSAPHEMGVAWFAIADQIKRGKIVVLDEQEAM